MQALRTYSTGRPVYGVCIVLILDILLGTRQSTSVFDKIRNMLLKAANEDFAASLLRLHAEATRTCTT